MSDSNNAAATRTAISLKASARRDGPGPSGDPVRICTALTATVIKYKLPATKSPGRPRPRIETPVTISPTATSAWGKRVHTYRYNRRDRYRYESAGDELANRLQEAADDQQTSADPPRSIHDDMLKAQLRRSKQRAAPRDEVMALIVRLVPVLTRECARRLKCLIEE